MLLLLFPALRRRARLLLLLFTLLHFCLRLSMILRFRRDGTRRTPKSQEPAAGVQKKPRIHASLTPGNGRFRAKGEYSAFASRIFRITINSRQDKEGS